MYSIPLYMQSFTHYRGKQTDDGSLSPMELAQRQNKKLLAAYQARMAKSGAAKQLQATLVSISLIMLLKSSVGYCHQLVDVLRYRDVGGEMLGLSSVVFIT